MKNGKYVEIPVDSLEIGQSQVRTDLTKGVDDLASSIAKQGLLNPITVVPLPSGNYEIVAGQRRYLACRRLGYTAIPAMVREDADALAVSLTENMVRVDNSKKELIDACTQLYRKYGSVKAVAEETGIAANKVSEYVKYDQLVPDLKELVDNSGLEMKVALQAQKAAQTSDGDVDAEAATKFALELKGMSNVQRKNFVGVVKRGAGKSAEELIEEGRKQPVLKQVLVTLEDSMHGQLQRYASEESINQDEAASTLIEDGLSRRGYNEQ